MTRVFQRRPSVAMHHQRSACDPSTSSSITAASVTGTSGRRTKASTRHPTSSPVCSTTITV